MIIERKGDGNIGLPRRLHLDLPDAVFAAACNLGNFLRRLALPRPLRHRSLITIGAKVVTHSRLAIFQIREVGAPPELVAAILEQVQRFGVPPPLVSRDGLSR